MNRYPDGAGLVSYSTGYGLPDPPGGISREFVPLCIIKLFNGLDETEIPLLYQIQEEHSASNIAFRDRDHETQVRLAELLLCPFSIGTALFHLLRKFHLFIRGKERYLSYLLQVHPYRILNGYVFRNGKVYLLGLYVVIGLGYDDVIVNIVICTENVDLRPLKEGHDLCEHFGIQLCIREEVHYLLIFKDIVPLPRERKKI